MWLHPINSHKYLKGLEMNVVDDLVTNELIAEKYATKNPSHMDALRTLFTVHDVFVPNLVDSTVDMRSRCLEFSQSIGLTHESAFAFLRRDLSPVRVHVSAVENPGRFYVQQVEFYSQLEKLNNDIATFMAFIETEKQKGSYNFSNFH